MPGRLLDVNAYTTLDLVDASARGPDWADDGPAVVDVRLPDEGDVDGHDEEGDGVLLELELDRTSLANVAPHADRLSLTREQARTLADALVTAAETDGADGRGGRGDR